MPLARGHDGVGRRVREDADEAGAPPAEPYRLVRALTGPRAAVSRRLPVRWRRRAAVFLGSVAGTGLRAAVGLLPHPPAGWPWGTFVANLSGALLLGYLLTRFQAAGSTTTLTVPLLCTGVLGSYTTFSAFALETQALVQAGRPGLGVAYGAVSVGAGFALALAGVRLAEART